MVAIVKSMGFSPGLQLRQERGSVALFRTRGGIFPAEPLQGLSALWPVQVDRTA